MFQNQFFSDNHAVYEIM